MHASSFSVRLLIVIALSLAAAWGVGGAALAQVTPGLEGGVFRSAAPAVFIDCQNFSCDRDYFQQEIGFVRHVREPSVADVHVLVRVEYPGSGGRVWTLTFLGNERFEGVDEQFVITGPQGEAGSIRRDRLMQALAVGLSRYAARAGNLEGLYVRFDAAEAEALAPPDRDPWNRWLFRVSASGSISGEERFSTQDVNGQLRATRTTEAVNLEARLDAFTRRQRFVVGDDVTLAIQERYRLRGLNVYSIGANWAVGAGGEVSRSSFENYALRARLGPALEYNVFPYAEASHRQLRVLYAVQPEYAEYFETTIFGLDNEFLVSHALSVAFGLQRPWGGASFSVQGAHLLTYPDRYSLSASGGLGVRLLPGLQLDVSSSAALIRDQISLAAGDPTDEEVLLRQRQLATGYNYRTWVGVSYTFGSIYNPAVNHRFGGDNPIF